MERRFNQPFDQIRANLRRQARVPIRGTYLKNSNGTAVGLVFESEKLTIVALPGPPQELQPMVREELVPYLNRRFGTRLPGCSLTLRFVGIGQSAIDQTLDEHVPLPADVIVTSHFDGARVDFTFILPNDTPEDRRRLDDLKQKIVPHLAEYYYGENGTSLEKHVIGLLKARGETVVLAEVASGGALAAALSPAEGSEGVLTGAYAAPTHEALRHLIAIPDARWSQLASDAQKVELLARAAAERTRSQWAIAVGATRQDANATSGADVVIKLADGRVDSVFVPLRGSGDMPRQRLTTQVLDRLRRKLR
jgi:nicotinamide-nucleotide amidase